MPIDNHLSGLPAVDPLVIAGKLFPSRLFIGTGKFSSGEVMKRTLAACSTALATVALKRAVLTGERGPYGDILDFLEPERYLVLANTAGAMNADEAVRLSGEPPRKPRAPGAGDHGETPAAGHKARGRTVSTMKARAGSGATASSSG